VLTAFRAQLEAGLPLTVTDRDATRFFMTVEEAVQLVIQAGAIGEGGRVLVLDMGEPVRIAEVAEQLAQTVQPPGEIQYVGLRPGEKVHEVLFGATEQPTCSSHSLIRSVWVPPVDGDCVRNLSTTITPGDAANELVQLCIGMELDLATQGAWPAAFEGPQAAVGE
jgi:FlaA1/EpsC-like NDP-sugar epimerase